MEKRAVPARIRFALNYPDVVLQQAAEEAAALRRATVTVPVRLLAYREGALGYGGSDRWPFDISLAIGSAGYRTGITRAIANKSYDSAWRFAAARDIQTVEFCLARIERKRAKAERRAALDVIAVAGLLPEDFGL